MEIKNKENQNNDLPVQPNPVAYRAHLGLATRSEPRNEEAFQAFLISYQKRQEVYRRLADS